MIPIHETRFSFIHLVNYYLDEIFHGGKKNTWNKNVPGIDDISYLSTNLFNIERFFFVLYFFL